MIVADEDKYCGGTTACLLLHKFCMKHVMFGTYEIAKCSIILLELIDAAAADPSAHRRSGASGVNARV